MAARGQQFRGGSDSPDVISDMGEIHFEVKGVEKLNIYAAMEQAIRDCGNKIPVVPHRKNNKEWLVTLRAKDIKRAVMHVKDFI